MAKSTNQRSLMDIYTVAKSVVFKGVDTLDNVASITHTLSELGRDANDLWAQEVLAEREAKTQATVQRIADLKAKRK